MDTRLLTRLGTLRQVEIFLKVAEKKSIARAADELFLTQPSVSNQIKKLSEALNIELYEVIGKQIYLTAAGDHVVQAGLELFEVIRRLDEDINALKGFKSGTIKIAVVTTAKYFLPHILGPYCKEYPDIDVEFKVGNRAQIIERLKKNLDDFYIFSDPPDDLDIVRYKFLPNPLAIIASKSNPLSSRKKLTWNDLSDQKFLLREDGSGTNNAVMNHLKKHNLTINKKMVIESNEAIKHAVIENMGVAIISAYVLSKGEADGLRQLAVKTFPIMSNWYLVHLREKKLSSVTDHFLKFVLNKHQDILPMKKIEAQINKAIKKY
ncbi:LysR family transcriptional regulator [Oceanicoccus sp. KOV_DT_Chl]|uniref:LysR family transcriptional regulator n=1 Tax=Oceanicoccus sp. KOV_DT_Chl TaxID=1904639 RepID=UPI000C7DCFB1|nr:LysR family transcriptional regulator [Oceanicoccus sp. KOV_DT_Chl]